MRSYVIAVLVCFTSVAVADFNRTTGLIDIPVAEVLPHGTIRGGVSISFSEESPTSEENFTLSVGLLDRAEVSVGILSREATEVNLLWKILEEGSVRPAVGVGIWNIAHEEHVSDGGFGSNAYADELGYGADRPKERLSGFCVLSKHVVPNVRFHMGVGRGRFVGWGDRSERLRLGDRPDSAVGLFLGLDARIIPQIQLMGELDGRDINVGLRYSREWLDVNLAVAKLEHLMFDSEHSPRYVMGGSTYLPLWTETQ